jgi:hypothetical protein
MVIASIPASTQMLFEKLFRPQYSNKEWIVRMLDEPKLKPRILYAAIPMDSRRDPWFAHMFRRKDSEFDKYADKKIDIHDLLKIFAVSDLFNQSWNYRQYDQRYPNIFKVVPYFLENRPGLSRNFLFAILPPEQRQDPEIAKLFIEKDPMHFKYLVERLKRDPRIILHALDHTSSPNEAGWTCYIPKSNFTTDLALKILQKRHLGVHTG